VTLDITFHYPPELMSLLIDTVPKLCKSKEDLLLFFKGAGVARKLLAPYDLLLETNRDGFKKYQVTRELLTTLNESGEKSLRERREVLRRVTEFENFSACWEGDQLKAKGLVAEIRQVVNIKDSFTRMAQERDAERRQHQVQKRAETEALQRKQAEMAEIQRDLCALFGEANPQKRGKALEGVLNRLFKAHGILVREAFGRRGIDSEGVIEQIDGVVEMDGQTYLVEMKWWEKPLGAAEVSPHIVRVFSRAGARAIILSYSGFTDAAIATCRDALRERLVVLGTLQEIVTALEQGVDLRSLLARKIQAAILDKNPFVI